MKNIFVFDGKLSIVCRRNSKSHERKFYFFFLLPLSISLFHSFSLCEDGRKRERDAKERRKNHRKKYENGSLETGREKQVKQLSIFSSPKFLMQKSSSNFQMNLLLLHPSFSISSFSYFFLSISFSFPSFLSFFLSSFPLFPSSFSLYLSFSSKI